jgi:hypothetical protein
MADRDEELLRWAVATGRFREHGCRSGVAN